MIRRLHRLIRRRRIVLIVWERLFGIVNRHRDRVPLDNSRLFRFFRRFCRLSLDNLRRLCRGRCVFRHRVTKFIPEFGIVLIELLRRQHSAYNLKLGARRRRPRFLCSEDDGTQGQRSQQQCLRCCFHLNQSSFIYGFVQPSIDPRMPRIVRLIFIISAYPNYFSIPFGGSRSPVIREAVSVMFSKRRRTIHQSVAIIDRRLRRRNISARKPDERQSD